MVALLRTCAAHASQCLDHQHSHWHNGHDNRHPVIYIYILILIVKVVPYVRSPMNVRMRRFSVRGVICTNLHHAIIIPATSKSKDALSAWMAVNEL